MNTEPGVNIEELLRLLKGKAVPLPWELGSFVALSACEVLLDGPCGPTAADLWVNDLGEVGVASTAGSATDEDACRGLVVLLGDLLVCSAPGVPEPLLQLVEKGPSSGEWSLSALRDDLEASLVPLNRGASRRVLVRLTREAQRDANVRAAGGPDTSELGLQTDRLLGVDPGQVPPTPEPAPESEAGNAEPAAEPDRPLLRSEHSDLIDHEQQEQGGARSGLWVAASLLALGGALAALYFGVR